MTDISVVRAVNQVEKLSWLLDRGGFEQESITLDVSAFTKATHYPDGFIPSGTAISKIADTGLYGPYVEGGEDAGFLATSTTVPTSGANVGAALLFSGVVKLSKLPASVSTDFRAATAAWIRFV